MHVCLLSHHLADISRLFATPWAIAHQAPLPMYFSRKSTGVGSPSPSLPLLQSLTVPFLYFTSSHTHTHMKREWGVLVFKASITNCHELSSLKQWIFIVSRFWSLYIWYQVVDTTVFPLKSVEKSSCLFLSFGGWPAVFGVPWLAGAWYQSLPLPSNSLLPMCLFLYLAVFL